MRSQAASTSGCWGMAANGLSKISRLSSTCAQVRSKTVNDSNTSTAVCERNEVENTVRQMMSAVRWLIARSSENGSPESQCASSRCS